MIENSPRFGEDFKFNPANRLDVLRKTEELPEYLKTGLAVRETLREEIKKEGWPECPEEFSGLQNFFDQAGSTVNEKWGTPFLAVIDAKKEDWLSQIPSTPENEEMIRLLKNPEALKTQIEMQQFGALENIRKIAPEAWKTLITLSSERQLAKLSLARRWSKELKPEQLQELGTGQEELDLFLDAAGIMGKYFDQAYLKQIELADLPSGSLKSPLGAEKGAKYLYDLETSSEVDLKPYVEVFPFEWPRIVKRFNDLARKTENLLAEGKIPDSYQGFAPYLRKLSEAYGSTETDVKKLPDLWEELSSLAVELAQNECPIMLIPEATPSVAGEANKVDAELRFGFQTKETKELKDYLKTASAKAEKLNLLHQDALATKDRAIPEIVPNSQPFAFGPNLYWMTRGQSDKGYIFLHHNSITEVAAKRERPILERSIEGFSLNEAAYGRASVRETALHEIGHAVLSREDDDIHKRLGVSPEADILEELKAETVGIKIFVETLDKTEENYSEKIKNQFFAKIGTLADYLLNKSSEIGSSGERYYYAAIALFDVLLKEGVLKEKDDKYEITDAEKGLELIASAGTELLESFYANLEVTPEQVIASGKQLRAKKDTEPLKRFIENLKIKSVTIGRV